MGRDHAFIDHDRIIYLRNGSRMRWPVLHPQTNLPAFFSDLAIHSSDEIHIRSTCKKQHLLMSKIRTTLMTIQKMRMKK